MKGRPGKGAPDLQRDQRQEPSRSAARPQVIEIRRLNDGGNLKAFAKVKLGCVVLHGCRIIQQDGQRPWVALPQTPARKKADGSGSGWYPVVEITNRDVLDQLRQAVLDAWERAA